MIYDILRLNEMLVPELREIAEQLGVKGNKKMNKQDLVFQILDRQALGGASSSDEKSESEEVHADPKKEKTSAAHKGPKTRMLSLIHILEIDRVSARIFGKMIKKACTYK